MNIIEASDQVDYDPGKQLRRNGGWKSGNIHCWLIDILHEGRGEGILWRTVRPGRRAATKSPLQGFSSGREDDARCTATCDRLRFSSQYILDGVRGGYGGVRWRLLFHAAAAAACMGSGSESGKQRTSLKISLCRRTATTEMLPTSVKPARVFVLRARGRPGDLDQKACGYRSR
ncbi:hypothetical protein QTP88_014393 [Uroleucon formosanum]